MVSSTIIFQRLGCASFFGDEAIYAVVAKEGAEAGEWLPLHFGGRLYLHKPPLKILLVTGLFSIFGPGELVARVPDAVFGVATIALVYMFAARRYGLGAGLLAGGILTGAESFLVIHGVRDSTQDALITLLAFVLVWAWLTFREGGSVRTRSWVVAVAAVVLAGLCKNAMGVLFALTIVGLEIGESVFERRKTGALKPALILLGIAAGAAVTYFVVMLVMTRGAFAAELVEDLWVRSTSGLDANHLQGPGFYLHRLVQDFGWWLLLVAPAFYAAIGKGRGKNDRTARLLGGWLVIVLGGFSLSVSKLPWYIYPAYPTLSVIVGIGANQLLRGIRHHAVRVVAVVVLVTSSAVHLRSAWSAVKADTRVIDADLFVSRLRTADDAQLIVHLQSIKARGKIREWNRYYLSSPPNVQWVEHGAQRYFVHPETCSFIACGGPRDFPPTEHFPWRAVARIPKHDPGAADIWIIGTCDLEVPASLAASGDPWDDLLVAEGFEGGDSGGLRVEEE